MSEQIPFDIERAKAGDEVEMRLVNPDEWIACKVMLDSRLYTGRSEGNNYMIPVENYGWWHIDNLRMRYPTKVAKNDDT